MRGLRRQAALLLRLLSAYAMQMVVLGIKEQYGCPRIASVVDIGACALPYSAGNFQVGLLRTVSRDTALERHP